LIIGYLTTEDTKKRVFLRELRGQELPPISVFSVVNSFAQRTRFLSRLLYCIASTSPESLTLGGRIKRYRYIRGISQKELARQIGIDPTTLSRLERERGRCSPSVLRKVAVFLDALRGDKLVKRID